MATGAAPIGQVGEHIHIHLLHRVIIFRQLITPIPHVRDMTYVMQLVGKKTNAIKMLGLLVWFPAIKI